MKIRYIFFSAVLLFSGSVNAQQLIVSDEASFNLSEDVNLVLEDMSLTNEGDFNGSDGTLTVTSTGEVWLSTINELDIDSLSIGEIGGVVTAGGRFNVSDLSIAANDNLYLTDTSQMTLSGSAANYGNLILNSGASLWFKASVNSIAPVTVYRTTTFDSNTGKYSVVGSPLESNAFSSLGDNSSWVFSYDETEPYGSDGSARFKSPEEPYLNIGKGYFSAFTGDENGQISFYGTPNYKNTTVAVTRTQDTADDYEGFNLIANPYTCPISFDQFVETNSERLDQQAIWIWDDFASDEAGGGSNSDYMTINALGNTDSRGGRLTDWDGTINVAQGFFIKAAESTDLQFIQSMKTFDGNDDQSYFRKSNIPIEKYWLGIKNETGQMGSNTLLGLHPDATYSFDKRFDASKFNPSFSVYSIIGDRKLAIQGVPDDWFFSDEPINLGYEVMSEGTYVLVIEKSAHSSGNTLYLVDHMTHEIVEILSEGYAFESQAGSFNNRFSLTSNPSINSTLSLNESGIDLMVFGAAGRIRINSDMDGHIKVWTLDGQMLHETELAAGASEIEAPAPGIYLVGIKSQYGSATYKVTVNGN